MADPSQAICSRCGHAEHFNECPECGSDVEFSTGRTGRLLRRYVWVCGPPLSWLFPDPPPAFLPPLPEGGVL